MSRIKSKFIRFGTGTDEVNSRSLPANFTPTNYTPAQVGTEGNDKVSAHLNGIDTALGSIVSVPGDIGPTAWNSLANNTANQTITGLIFAATVRTFSAEVSIYIDNGASGLWTNCTLKGVRKGTSDWSTNELSLEYTGDNVLGISFNINNVTTSGQVRISIGNISGFVSGELRFRAIALSN